MNYSDNYIENNAFFLRNNVNITTPKDLWFTCSTGAYGIYTMNYVTNLEKDHYYYQYCKYKYTTTGNTIDWVNMYQLSGYAPGSGINNPAANTEYDIYGVVSPVMIPYTVNLGIIYNGALTKCAGVTAQLKNVMVLDVTELYKFLVATGTIEETTTALKTWCYNNIEYAPYPLNIDLTDKISELTNKIAMKNGYMMCNLIIEPDGLKYYSILYGTNTPYLKDFFFDVSKYQIEVYNNAGGGTVTITRELTAEAQGSPFAKEHPYILKIQTNGTASPSAGGFVPTAQVAAANKVIIERFIAKVPVGYTLNAAWNAQGTGYSVTWQTPQVGTGEWEEYAVLYRCGSSGSFSTGGHIYASGSDNTNVTWYLAALFDLDVTDNEDLITAPIFITKNRDKFKAGNAISYRFDNRNLFPTGDYSDTSVTTKFYTSTTFDYDDIPLDSSCNACASLVQAPSSYVTTFSYKMEIDPTCRYRISYWWKGDKTKLTNFLTAMVYYDANGNQFTHTNTIYVAGTKTRLTQDLVAGDTTIKVASNANWVARANSNIGIRESISTARSKRTENTNGSAGMVDSITGTDTINLKVAWTGATVPTGTYIVENYDGGTFAYPISKNTFSTSTDWQYVYGTFGTPLTGTSANILWDGNNANGSWSAIPLDAKYVCIYLDLYKNYDTTNPMKYADIRVECISKSAHKLNQKIQFKKFDD